MLPKKRRIERKLFPLLNKGAKIFRNRLFLLRLANIEAKESRFGFSVSKKVAKSAVVRNRMRRMGYRTIKQYIEQLPPSLLVSFTFQQVPKNEEEVEENLKNILIEAKLLQY